MNGTMTDPGFYLDGHGVTMLARVVLDGRLFGFIPETEGRTGWHLGQVQGLADKIEAEWDKHGNLPSRLPPEQRERRTALYKVAVDRAREKGWDPKFGEDE